MSCSISRIEMPSSSRIGEQQLVEVGAFARVEAGGGLVEAEQHADRCTWRARSRAGAGRHRAGRRPDRRRASIRPTRSSQRSRLVDRGAFGGRGRGRSRGCRGACKPEAASAVVLGDHQVFQRRHAGEQADVLEGAGDARLLRDLMVRHALEQIERAMRPRAPSVRRCRSARRVRSTPSSPWRSRCVLRSACRSR